MSWLQPLGLLALLALPLIVLLHALRPRHRSLPVSSLLLWQDADVSPRSRRRWRPPRLTILLALQLILAALAAFALGHLATERERGRHLAIVLDTSRVMQATDVPPSRFEAARSEAAQRLGGLGPGDAATVILAGATADTLARAADPGAALAALQQRDQGLGNGDQAAGRGPMPDPQSPLPDPPDLGPAVELASAALRSAPARANELVVLTGSSLDSVTLSDVPARLTVRTFGTGGANVGVVAFDVRRLPGEAAARGYARVVNFGDGPATTQLSLSADRLPLERLPLSLGPRSERQLTFSVPSGVREVVARLEPAGSGQTEQTDALAADDRAAATIGGARREVILVGPSGDLLQRALSVLPGVTVRHLTPAQYSERVESDERRATSGSDEQPASCFPLRASRSCVIVFSGWVPDQPPAAPALIVAPPPGSGWLPVSAELAAGRLAKQDAQSPLLRGVDLRAIDFGPIRPAPLPDWAASSAEVAGGSLIYQGMLNGRRLAMLAFDPAGSNLPKLPAFPLLLANSLEWLAPAPAGSGSLAAEQPARERLSDLRPPAAPAPLDAFEALAPERLIDATWWRWLIVAALVIAAGEWWRYGHEVR